MTNSFMKMKRQGVERGARDGEIADIVNRGHLVVYIQLGHFRHGWWWPLLCFPLFFRTVCCRLSDRQGGKNITTERPKRVGQGQGQATVSVIKTPWCHASIEKCAHEHLWACAFLFSEHDLHSGTVDNVVYVLSR